MHPSHNPPEYSLVWFPLTQIVLHLMQMYVIPLLLARIFHKLLSRDREDGRATGQPQGVGSEAYLNGTSQGPTPEDARKDGHIRGRSK